MIRFIYIAIIFSYAIGIAQERGIYKDSIQQLVSEVHKTSGSFKLALLDSLTKRVMHQSEYGYDEHARATIDLALELDSIDLATYHASQYIFYLANRDGKPREGINYFDSFIAKDLKILNKNHKAQLYLNGGDSYFFGGETSRSIALYERAGSLALEAGDSLLLGKSKTYMSDAYADTGKFAEAGLILSEAELIFETMKDTFNLLTTRNSRANLYSRIGFYDEAHEVRNEIVQWAEQRNDYRMLQSTLYNVAIDARLKEDYAKSISYLNKALHFAKLGELDGYVPKIQISLLKSYALIDSLDQARSVLANIEQDSDRYEQGLDAFNFTTALAVYHFKLGNFRKARDLSEKLFSTGSVKDFGNAKVVHDILSSVYDSLGDSKMAYYHFQKLAGIRDSITDIQNVRALTYYQTLYETKRRDATISEQQAEIAFLDVQNKLKRQWLISGSIGIVILGIIGYLTWLQINVQRRKRLMGRFSQELIRTQETERSRLARDLHDSVGQKLMLLSKKTKAAGDQQLEFLAASSLDEIRTISRGLHPASIEKLGISKALEGLVNQIDANTEILFTCDIDTIDDQLNKENALQLYRIVQEVLNNMVKHSKTRSATVSIQKKAHHIGVQIVDSGQGFQFSDAIGKSESLGMRTLMERAKIINSKLEVTSIINQGTTVQLVVPFSS
ncbi:MAG: sensor histidine kinase [Bacteroidota bacterium]